MNKKICLITHLADADGAFPIILSKLVFKEIDVFSCEIGEVDAILREIMSHQEDYENIYIVDITMSEDMADDIDKNNALKEKICVFDHHKGNMALNRYSFIHIVDEGEFHKECGTTLYYKHLKKISNCKALDKKCLKTMIELIRQGDTYDFSKELKDMAFQFGSLYAIYGREKYIEHFYEYIISTDEDFQFSEVEKTLIEIENNRTNKYIEEKMKHVKKAYINGISVGIVFAEQNRSLLGHAMAENMDIDIAVVINVDRSVSYRADKDEVDIAVIAKPLGGGGHKHAGGSPLPIDLQKMICEYIFKEITWENKN